MKRLKEIILYFCLIAAFITGCAYIQKKIDAGGIEDIAEEILEDYDVDGPDSLARYLKELNLKTDTLPNKTGSIKRHRGNRWEMSLPSGRNVVHEKIEFPSQLMAGKKKDTACFYIFRTKEFKGSRYILWVPGLGVSDFAFRFIKDFFQEQLSRDWNICFYVPPRHLERTVSGLENGEGFLRADTVKNIELIVQMIKELRTACEYLRGMGVKRIGGWGGSIGATALLQASRFEDFDHLCVMIPVINLKTIAVDNIEMKPVIERLIVSGYTKGALVEAYCAVSPEKNALTVNPSRVQILLARYDQMTSEKLIWRYAEKNNITNIKAYDRGHGTILLTSDMYNDYGSFLDKMN